MFTIDKCTAFQYISRSYDTTQKILKRKTAQMKTTGFCQKSNTFPVLFPVDVDTRLSDILKNAFRLLEINTEILEKIDHDLDAYALDKMKKRLSDAAWTREHSLSLGLRVKESEKPVETELDVGRPRMASIAAYLFVILPDIWSWGTSYKGSKATRRSLCRDLYGESEKVIVHNFSRMTIVAERKRKTELLPAA